MTFHAGLAAFGKGTSLLVPQTGEFDRGFSR